MKACRGALGSNTSQDAVWPGATSRGLAVSERARKTHVSSESRPVVPPTAGLVAAMLAYSDRDPLDVLGVLPPRHGLTTVEAVAINAVLAGCEPRALPVVLAAVQAILDESHNVAGLNSTTHPVAEVLLVNGPIARELGIASGSGCFGPAFPANASIGRALRLVLLNVGGAPPGRGDRKSVVGGKR